jgi:hypothetical protein
MRGERRNPAAATPGSAQISRVLVLATIVEIVYWAAWFIHPALLTDDHSREYARYENSFLLAHAWSMATVLIAYLALRRQQLAAVALWLPCAAGSKGFVCGVDILHNLQHHDYAGPVGYVTLRIALNVLAFGFTALALKWTWDERRALTRPAPTVNSQPARRPSPIPTTMAP